MCSSCFCCFRNCIHPDRDLAEPPAPVRQSMSEEEERLPFDRHHLFTKSGRVWIHKCHNEEGAAIHSFIIQVRDDALKRNPQKTNRTVIHQCAEGQKFHRFTVPREYDYRLPSKEKKKETIAVDFSRLYSAAAPKD